MGAYRSSMQVDRQQGRPLEVEAILGEPLRRAQAGGVKTPILESLYRAARVVDASIGGMGEWESGRGGDMGSTSS
jgi:ketopantoate reductase